MTNETVVRNFRAQMIEPKSISEADIEAFVTSPECTADTLCVAVRELAGKLRAASGQMKHLQGTINRLGQTNAQLTINVAEYQTIIAELKPEK